MVKTIKQGLGPVLLFFHTVVQNAFFIYDKHTVSAQLARNTFHLTLASIGQKLIAFVYFLFLARVMQPELTGTYFLAVSIAMIFSVIADFGITPVTIREIAKHPEHTTTLVRNALAAKIPLLLIGYACTLLAVPLLGYGKDLLVLVMFSGLSLILDSVHLLFYGVLRGHHVLQFESLGMFASQLVVATIGGLSLWIAPSLPLLLFALVAGSTSNVLVSGFIILRRFGAGVLRPVWNQTKIKQLLFAAFPFALAAIFVKVYSYVDTLFISKLIDETAVGLYSIAYKLTYAFQFIPLAFTAALYPSISAALAGDRAQVAMLLRRALWYMALVATPIVFGLWLVAEPAVRLAGDSYTDAAPILSVLVFVLIPIFLDFPIGSLLNAADRQATKTAIMGGTMIINVILNIVLIPSIGTVGAAYAALGSFVFMFLCGLLFVKRIVPSFRFSSVGRDLLPIAISGLLMLVVGQWLLPLFGWMGVIPACAVVYAVMLIITGGFTRNDWIKIKTLLRV